MTDEKQGENRNFGPPRPAQTIRLSPEELQAIIAQEATEQAQTNAADEPGK